MSKFIKYGDKTLPMPEDMTLEQAKQIMARHFPELAENPKIENKKDGDDTTYIFSKQAGRKGANPAAKKIAARLNKVKETPVVPERYRDGRIILPAQSADELRAECEHVARASAALLDLAPASANTGSVLL